MTQYSLGDLRKLMDQALKAHVVPDLRAAGFKGSYPNFRRVTPDGVEFLSFAFDRYGGSFCIEIGAMGQADLAGRDVSKLTFGHLPWHGRHQIVSGDQYVGRDGFWFDYGQIDKCITQVKAKLPDAEAWWAARGSET